MKRYKLTKFEPTPQIMTAEEIYKKIREHMNVCTIEKCGNYCIIDEEFIPLSRVESALKEILEDIDKIFEDVVLGYYKTYGRITTNKKIKQIIIKSFKEKLNVEAKNV